MACSVRVFILTGLTEYVGELATTKILSVYSKRRAAEDAVVLIEEEGWNVTKKRPATENDADTDEIVQYDTVEIVERSLKGAAKIVHK